MIEGVQKRTGKTFTREQIESGILKDIITDEDYDLIRVVSRSNIASLRFRVCCICMLNFVRIRMRKFRILYLQKDELSQERRKVLSDEARRLYREEPDLFKAATKEFKGNS